MTSIEVAVDGSHRQDGSIRPVFPILSIKALSLIVGGVEVVFLTAGGVFGNEVYVNYARYGFADPKTAFGVGLLCGLLYVLASYASNLYQLPALLHPIRHMRRAALVCGFVLMALTAVLFLLKIESDFSRGPFIALSAAMLVLCCMTRLITAAAVEYLLSKDRITGRTAFVIGDRDELESLKASTLLRTFGFREMGRLPLESDIMQRGGECLNLVNNFIDEARSSQIKEFLVVSKWDAISNLQIVEEALRVSPFL